MSISLSSLLTLLTPATDAGSQLLNTLYGSGGSSTSSTDPLQALQSAELNQTQQIKVTAAQPMVKTTVSNFTKIVHSATSITQLLSNPQFMSVLLTANGMTDQIGYTALATKALTSNLSDPKSLANVLNDTRWKALAKAYDFSSTTGLASFQKAATIATLANAYATSTWQAGQDAVAPGLTNALTFKATASTITSVDQILGDPTMRTVVTTTLGIPQQIAFQSITAQENAITSKIDIKKFQDPKFVETFIKQYLIANAAAASSSSSSSSSSATDLTSLAAQA